MPDPTPHDHANAAPPTEPTAPRGPTLYCPACGYDLTTREDQGVCPECGAAFDAQELRRSGGLPRVNIWPLLLTLIATPVLLVTALLACLVFVQNVDIGVPIFIMLSLAALAGAGTSIYVGRIIARRLVKRPPKSMPNAGSVTLTIVFSILLFAAQAVTAGVLFFVGCSAAFITGVAQ